MLTLQVITPVSSRLAALEPCIQPMVGIHWQQTTSTSYVSGIANYVSNRLFKLSKHRHILEINGRGLSCVSGPTVLVYFLICHAQLSRQSLPLQTTRPAPPPASFQTASERSKFAKEEELSEFAKGLVPENTNKVGSE